MQFLTWWSIISIVTITIGYECGDTNTELLKEYMKFRNLHYSDHENHLLENKVLCKRMVQFQKNLQIVEKLNHEEEGNAIYSVLHSPFGDWDEQEFREKVLMKTSFHAPATIPQRRKRFKSDTFDWVSKGVLSNIKTQGTIGSCYAFAAAASVEAQAAIQFQKHINVSVEQVIECSANADTQKNDANCGEFGGWPRLVFEYWNEGGFLLDQQFPYCAGTVDKHTLMPLCFPCMANGYYKHSCGSHKDLYCNATSTLGQGAEHMCEWKSFYGKVKDWQSVSSDPEEIAQVIKQKGPVTAVIDARLLQFYHRGIASPKYCSQTAKNHAVLIVGYGPGYWKIRNSWGPTWGENGYFRLEHGKCGIQDVLSTVSIQLDGADENSKIS